MKSLLTAALFGTIIGSFIAMLSYRLPLMLRRQWHHQAQDILALSPGPGRAKLGLGYPASHCPHCQHQLAFWENIPVVSYLILWGRCRACRAPISWRYPLLELIAAVMAAAVIWTHGFNPQAYALLLLGWGLLLLAAIDQEHFLLPDCVIFPLLWAGLLLNLNDLFVPVEQALWGVIAGYLCLWLLYWAFKVLTGRDGMGRGDFKLLSMLGAWAGYSALPVIILLASSTALLSALACQHRQSARQIIPFGPYLAAGGWFSLLWQEQITSFRYSLPLAAIW